MSLDVLDRFDEIADIAGELLTAGIWILVALFGFIASLRDKSKRRDQEGQPEWSAPSLPRSQESSLPDPYAPSPVGDPAYGTLYTSIDDPQSSTDGRRDTREGEDDDPELTYGSRDKAVWRSVFDEPGQESKWGFDESEWGSAFGPNKNSEPTISQG